MSRTPDATALPPAAAMRAMIQRIATGPDLSKPLTEAEARYGMQLILDGEADPVQAGIFLIALRMKRETPDENVGVLHAIRDACQTTTVDVDSLVDLVDPYNGYARTLSAAPFLPPVLAACGVNVLSHGVPRCGPKFGATHNQVLAAAGVDVSLSVGDAARQIAGDAGWAYLDQQAFCPSLAALESLRTRIVKRPVLTTVEVLARPLIANHAGHLVTGYVHKPYPPVYSMLARAVGFSSCLLMRGTEGGVVPSLRQPGKAWRYEGDGEDEELDLDPGAVAIDRDVRAGAIPDDVLATAPDAELPDGPDFSVAALARATADAGLAALRGDAGVARDSLVFSGAHVLLHLGRAEDVQAAAQSIRTVLDDGSAFERLKAAA